MSGGISGADAARDTATVLLHVAKADGNADAAELGRIQAIVRQQAKNRDIEAPEIEPDSVTEQSFTDALSRLSGMTTAFKASLVDHAMIVADVDGDVDANESSTIGAIANGLFDGDDVAAVLWYASARVMVRKAEAKLGLNGSIEEGQ